MLAVYVRLKNAHVHLLMVCTYVKAILENCKVENALETCVIFQLNVQSGASVNERIEINVYEVFCFRCVFFFSLIRLRSFIEKRRLPVSSQMVITQ